MRFPIKLRDWLSAEENKLALKISLIIILIIILTTGLSPLWIYSGF
ncbi:MAG: hypothetical protein JEZ00_06820 [Anaerolineaceae bacterium]|nr:hypothetical protein [Anaerolineaceae bacterium]